MTQMHLGWHFCAIRDGKPVLRDGSPLRIGHTYEHDGPLVMCESGYHDSDRVIDALRYSPGDYLCRTLASRDLADTDKFVSRYRVALVGYDASLTLHRFSARTAYCALVAERARGREPDPRSWAAVATKMRWCDSKASDKELAAAEAAARDAAWAAARAAARAAAWDAAWAAAEAAARDAAWAAAWDATRAAAWAAAEAAAGKLLTSMLPEELVTPSLMEKS